MKKRLQKFFINLICFFIPFGSIRKSIRKAFRNYLNNNKIIFVSDLGGGKSKLFKIKRFYQQIKGINFDLFGSNNTIYIDISDVVSYGKFIKSFSNSIFNNFCISVYNDNSIVKLKFPMEVYSSSIRVGSNSSYLEIGNNVLIRNSLISCECGNQPICKIGKYTTFGGVIIDVHDVSSCIIGEYCMFSYDVCLRCSDGHVIFDKDNKEILNIPKNNMIIGNHCWIGHRAILTKNVILPNNTIVGTDSLVTKKFTEEYTAIAGNPAKVIKTNVDWDRASIYDFINKKNKK